MNILILGAHSNESKKARCLSILVDNTLAIDAGALTSNLTLKNQEKIKSILLTHAHFDHIKDVPLLALNFYRMQKRISIYALQSTISTIKNHLLNGQVYPQMYELPVEKATVNFYRISPSKELSIDKYRVLPVPVNHSVETVGYQVSDKEGRGFFYSADTGPGLSACWKSISSQLIFIETTLPDSYEEYAIKTGHLTPRLLLTELKLLKKIKKDLPRIIIIHNDPLFENELSKELNEVAAKLKISITIATEGMRIKL